MSRNCNVIAFFPIYGRFGVIRKPDSGRIVCKAYTIINNNLLSYKNWKQNLKNLYRSFHIIVLSKGTVFAKKTLIFWEKMVTSKRY